MQPYGRPLATLLLCIEECRQLSKSVHGKLGSQLAPSKHARRRLERYGVGKKPSCEVEAVAARCMQLPAQKPLRRGPERTPTLSTRGRKGGKKGKMSRLRRKVKRARQFRGFSELRVATRNKEPEQSFGLVNRVHVIPQGKPWSSYVRVRAYRSVPVSAKERLRLGGRGSGQDVFFVFERRRDAKSYLRWCERRWLKCPRRINVREDEGGNPVEACGIPSPVGKILHKTTVFSDVLVDDLHAPGGSPIPRGSLVLRVPRRPLSTSVLEKVVTS